MTPCCSVHASGCCHGATRRVVSCGTHEHWTRLVGLRKRLCVTAGGFCARGSQPTVPWLTIGMACQQTNAYIVWALTGTSLKDKLTREVDALAIAAGESEGGAFNEDPYFLGLVAGALYNTGATEAARHVAERIVLRQVCSM